jgi:hypothetical protein
MSDAVDVAVDELEAPNPQPVSDRSRIELSLEQLVTMKDAVLPRGAARQLEVDRRSGGSPVP